MTEGTVHNRLSIEQGHHRKQQCVHNLPSQRHGQNELTLVREEGVQPEQNSRHGIGAVASRLQLVGKPLLGMGTVSFNDCVKFIAEEEARNIFSSSDSCSEKFHSSEDVLHLFLLQ